MELPEYLAEAAAAAVQIDRLKEYGYPQQLTLTPVEWAALDALQKARQNDSETTRRIEQEQADIKRRSDALQASINR